MVPEWPLSARQAKGSCGSPASLTTAGARRAGPAQAPSWAPRPEGDRITRQQLGTRQRSRVPEHNRQDLTQRSLGPATEKYRTLGTMANVSVFNRLGTLPTRNFQQSTFDEAEEVSGEEFVRSHHVKNAHCANCTIGCEHIMVTTDNGTPSEGRMEYESTFALGPLLGIGNPNVVIRASHLCDELGMDTISAGATIAWAMECFDRGVLTHQETGGTELRFGDEDAVMSGLRLIAQRDGLGDLLADGSRTASQVVGKGSGDWAMQVKGLEMPGYEPRSLKTMALGLAVSTRGACHNRSSAYEADFSSRVDRLSVDERRGRITKEGEDFSAVLDSLIWCKFLRKAFDEFYDESAAIYEHVTGWPMTPDQLKQAESASTTSRNYSTSERAGCDRTTRCRLACSKRSCQRA